MSILVDIIPEKYRKYALYAPFALVSLVLGAWAFADPSAEWVETALAVMAFVGSATGLTAYGNTGVTKESTPSE